MRKVGLTMYISLDGVIEDPAWTMPYWNEETVYPVVLGSGKRLFRYGSKIPLSLVDSKTFSSGVVALTYQPAGQAGK